VATKGPLEPFGWANWRACANGKPSLGAIEVGCYTDASPTGQLESCLGPLHVINTVPGERQIGLPNMALVLRVEIHEKIEPSQIRWSRTSVRGYTGADVGDEFGALLALALGIRCRSGGMIREFEPGDERGQPREWEHLRPYLPPPRFRRAPLLPRMEREVSLEDARDLLARYPSTSWRKAVALVRAARLYEQAVWVVEADPNLSWLLLVSAAETAAAEVHGLSGRGKRRHSIGPTQRFVCFIRDYAPPAPSQRPRHGQLDWSRMAEHADKIYEWRSRSLHDGIPFPSPMCLPPRDYDGDGVFEEATTGLASALGTTVWKRDDTPMLLATFAHITRHALMRWWEQTPMR
jgi:hypothetical protein